MSSPIFDLIVSQREATPIFETISGSFPSVRGDEVASTPTRARVRTRVERGSAPCSSSGRPSGGGAPAGASAEERVPTATWPLGRVG